MVKNVERVGLELQGEALLDLEILDHGKIETCLERGSENIPAVASVAGFQGIASGGPRSSTTARRNSALARAEEGDGEVVRVDIRNSDSGQGPRGEGFVGPALGGLLGRDSGSQRKNRIGDEVIRAIEDASGRSRKIDNTERFAAL